MRLRGLVRLRALWLVAMRGNAWRRRDILDHGVCLRSRHAEDLLGELAQLLAEQLVLLANDPFLLNRFLEPGQLGVELLVLLGELGIGLADLQHPPAAFQRPAQPLDVAPLALQRAPSLLQRRRLGADSVAQLAIGGFKLGDHPLGSLDTALQVRQAAPDGLLQHAIGVLVLLHAPFDGGELFLEHNDLDAALIALDQLARGLVLGLFQRHLDPAQRDGKLRPELVLVGLNIDHRHWHRRLDPARGETHGAVPQRRGQHECKQARDQEAERRKHTHVDHRTSAPIRAYASPKTLHGKA